MVDVYTQMKPDSLKSQTRSCKQSWQPTSISRTSRGFRTCAGRRRSVQGASGCTKSKVVKRKFEDQEDIERAPNAAAAATTTPATPATLPDGGAEAASGGEEPPPAHSPGGKSRGNKGLAGGGGKKASKA